MSTELSASPDDRLVHFRQQAEEEREAILKCVQESSRLEALGLLASGVSHDFNNLLTGLLGCVELAMEDVADRPNTLALLKNASSAGIQARELCSRIRDHVRRGTSQREKFDLHVLVNDAVGLLGACRKRVTFEFHLGAESAEVCAVAVEVRRILMNLLVNATEAMGEDGGQIVVTSRRIRIQPGADGELAPGEYVELSVQDDGAGISPAVLPRIFEPFFTTKTNGTGLGLSSVKSVLQQHGGTITVRSAIGVGTTFTLLLPFVGSVASTAAKPWGDAGRVLVIDDDELIRPLLARVLRSQGFSVDLAEDGPSALATFAAATTPYSAVMLDMTLPGGLDGAQVLQQLRARGLEAGVVLMSGLETAVTIQRIDRRHYASFLRKPFNSDTVISAVKQAISSRPTSAIA